MSLGQPKKKWIGSVNDLDLQGNDNRFSSATLLMEKKGYILHGEVHASTSLWGLRALLHLKSSSSLSLLLIFACNAAPPCF